MRGPSEAEVREKLTRLRATPKHFRRAAKGLSDEQLRRPPAAGEWSVNEQLAHLRGAADVQGGWIARILADDTETPTIRYASPRTGMRKGGYAEHEFAASLRAFAEQRSALVKALAALDAADWLRAAAFTGTTPGWTQTVLDVVTGLVTHEHAHFEQILSAADAVRAG